MANFGRVACVALPFVLTLGALIAMLVATLGGVTDKNLYIFQINTANLSVSESALVSLVTSRSTPGFHDPSFLDTARDSSGNKTAADLGLYDLYDVGLWGFCYTPQNGSRDCTKPAFNWAETYLNTTKSTFTTLITMTGAKVTLPKQVSDAITLFGTVARWTEITFIIALASLGVELFFGIFSNCSRAISCITFLVAGLATVATCTAASLATAMAVIVVGSVEATAKFYGVKASFNNRFLAAVWIAALFALAAGFFWLFTICCCAPDHSSRRSTRHRDLGDGEKLVPPTGAYHPIHEDHGYPGAYNPQQQHYPAPQYGYANNVPAPRRDLAYEPYSHANV